MRDLSDADTEYQVRWARLCVYIPRSPGQVPPKRPDFHPRSGHLNRGLEALDALPHPNGPGPLGHFSLHTKWYGIEWIGNWYSHMRAHFLTVSTGFWP